MIKNRDKKIVQFPTQLIIRFIGKGYKCEKIVGLESTVVHLKNEKAPDFIHLQTKLKAIKGNHKR